MANSITIADNGIRTVIVTQGPQGPAGRDSEIFVQQFNSSGSTTITHNLDQDFPIVQVYSASRAVFYPEITSVNENQITIDVSAFGYTVTGSVVISK